MVQRISSFSISLLLCLCTILPASAQQSQPTAEKKEKEKKAPEVEYPLFNGVGIGFDLWGPGSKLLGGDFLSTEVSATVDLKHRFFPTLELGYGKTDEWSDNGTHYKSGAPYFRIGMDYNTLYNKAHGHMLLVGLRYGATGFKYDIASPGVTDPIYGGSMNPSLEDDIYGGSVPYNHSGLKGSMQWLEICLGIRARVWKSLYMGWGLRLKYKLSASAGKYGDPWYVPGFGKYGSNTMGVNYSIIYKLPF